MKPFARRSASSIHVLFSLMIGSSLISADQSTDADGKDLVNKSITSGAYAVDLDVDSDNKNNFEFAGFTLEEDKIELKPPGKIIIATSNGNSDADDLWDYADGFNLEGLADKNNTYYPSLLRTTSATRAISDPKSVEGSSKFIPVQLTLVKGFDPAKAFVNFIYSPVSKPEIGDEGLELIGDGSKTNPYRVLPKKGGMRLWRVAPEARKSGKPVPAGDFVDSGSLLDLVIPSTDGIKFSDLKPEGSVANLYLEYLDTEPSTSAGLKGITAVITQTVNGVKIRKMDAVVVTLCPANVIAYKRAKCGAAGAEVPQNFGNFGYETVVIENGDDDINPDGDTADYEENVTRANMDKDDDFVKLTFKLSKSARIPGAKVSLVHEGMSISGQYATMGKWGTTTLPTVGNESRLRFYKDNGELLSDTDLTIANLSNPGNGYFAKIVTEGEVSVWVEGDRLFGGTGSQHHKMGGARVRLLVEQDGNQNYAATVLVYRGGFFQFKQVSEQPGEIMLLEFRDGKGRINTIGKPVVGKNKLTAVGHEFTIDEWDAGELIAGPWEARSGKKKDRSQGVNGVPDPGRPIREYWIQRSENDKKDGLGHTPLGWWALTNFREDVSPGQDDSDLKNKYTESRTQLRQGSYRRWAYDDPARDADPNVWMPYEKIYLYDRRHPLDSFFGPPTTRKYSLNPPGSFSGSVFYKADMTSILGNTAYARVDIQVHPDGWRDGTAGCIGMQSMEGCVAVRKRVRNMSGLKVRVKQ